MNDGLSTFQERFIIIIGLINEQINLYDHRQIKKGPVQTYEGQVNSHTRTQLGTDPSEKFLLSGGYSFLLDLF